MKHLPMSGPSRAQRGCQRLRPQSERDGASVKDMPRSGAWWAPRATPGWWSGDRGGAPRKKTAMNQQRLTTKMTVAPMKVAAR